MNSDFRAFFALLQAHGVEFLLIGGVAYNFHAPPRATKDIDVWARPTRGNVTRLIEAIREFGFPVEALSVEELVGERGQVLIDRGQTGGREAARPRGRSDARANRQTRRTRSRPTLVR
jgi:hypothetical protein